MLGWDSLSLFGTEKRRPCLAGSESNAMIDQLESRPKTRGRSGNAQVVRVVAVAVGYQPVEDGRPPLLRIVKTTQVRPTIVAWPDNLDACLRHSCTDLGGHFS